MQSVLKQQPWYGGKGVREGPTRSAVRRRPRRADGAVWGPA